MSQSRKEIKVGLFLLLGLVLLASLAILFSRGTPFWRNSLDLNLKSGNVGGIKPGASVLMRGVQIGHVAGAKLNPDGKGVTILLKVETQYTVQDNARFEIEQSGFLGDQFIAIYPADVPGTALKSGAEVIARNPFNMQEAVATATEAITKVSQVTSNLNAAVSDVRRLVLNESTLQNLAGSLNRLSAIADEAQATVASLNAMVSANTLPVTTAVSNLNVFTGQLPALGTYVTGLVTNNGAEISVAIRNLETTSATLTNLVAELQAGHGAAGRLLRDEEMASNLSAIAANLSITTSNLNTRGLWGILWKQKTPPPAKKD